VASFKILYRDSDRTPWLYALKHCAGQFGLGIQVEPLGARDSFEEALLAGSAVVAAESYHALQALRARGAPIVCLATSTPWLNEQLFVGPSIRSIDDLRGRRFALRGMASSEQIERLWIADHGLDGVCETSVFSDRETGRWQQWRKVLSGECQACFVTNLYADAAVQAGLASLPIQPYGYMGNVTLTTNRAVVQQDPAAAEALVRAAFDATRLFKSDPSATMGIIEGDLARIFAPPEQVSPKRVYEILRDELPEFPVPTLEGLANMRRMAMTRSPELAGFNPLLMWDLTFASRIVDERAGPLPS
jgi:ABC-type nitrate/sulfonate/bicarbonate transport system substrate-binding protein